MFNKNVYVTIKKMFTTQSVKSCILIDFVLFEDVNRAYTFRPNSTRIYNTGIQVRNLTNYDNLLFAHYRE